MTNPAWVDTVVDKRQLEDFYEFTRLQREAKDIDPLYPVLAHVFREWYPPTGDPELVVWAVLVYVAYYNAASALTALHELPAFGVPMGDMARLPTGIERRGLRGGAKLTKHLEELIFRSEFRSSFTRWLQEGWEGDPLLDWQHTRENALTAWGNGRWATYKLAEVLQKVLGWPIAAGDMGMDGASGPKQGLEILFGHSPYPDTREYITLEREAQGWALWEGARARGIDVDLAEIETCLCDYHGLCIGRYFVGHDVALLYDDVHALPEGPARAALLAAGETVLPSEFWRPMEPALRKLYSKSGKLGR